MSVINKPYNPKDGVLRVIILTDPIQHPLSKSQNATDSYYCQALDMKGNKVEVDLQALPPGITYDQIAPNQVWWVEKRTSLYRLYLYGGMYDPEKRRIHSTEPIPAIATSATIVNKPIVNNVLDYGATPLTTYQASSNLNNWNFNFGTTASGDSSLAFYKAYLESIAFQQIAGTPATIFIPAGDYIIDPSVAKWWTFTNDLRIECEDIGLTRIWLYDSNNTFGTWQNSVSISTQGSSLVTTSGSDSLVTFTVNNTGGSSINNVGGNTAFVPSVIIGDYLTVSGSTDPSYNGSWKVISTNAGSGTVQLLVSGTVNPVPLSSDTTLSIVRPVRSFIAVELLDASYLYGRSTPRPYLESNPSVPVLRPGMIDGYYAPAGMIGIDYGPGVYARIQAQFYNFDVRTLGYYSITSSPSIGLRIGPRDNYWCEDTIIEDGTLSRNCQIGLFLHNYNGQGSFQGTDIKRFYASTNQPGQIGIKLGYGNGIPITSVKYLAAGVSGNPTGVNCLKWTTSRGYNVGAAGQFFSIANMPYPEYNGTYSDFQPVNYGNGLVTSFYTTPGKATSNSIPLSGTLGEIQNSSTFYQSFLNAETVQQYQTPFLGNITNTYQLGTEFAIDHLTQAGDGTTLYVFSNGTPAGQIGSKFTISSLTSASGALLANAGKEFTVTAVNGTYVTATGVTGSGYVPYTAVTATGISATIPGVAGYPVSSGVPAFINANSKLNNAFTVKTPAPASGTAGITAGYPGGHATLTWSGSSNSFYYWQLNCGVYTDSLGLIGYIDPNTNPTAIWNPSTGTINSASVSLVRTIASGITDTFYVTNFPDRLVSPITVVTITGATYSGSSTTISGINTSTLVSGMYIFGAGMHVPTTITNVSSSGIVISPATGGSASNTSLWVDSYIAPDESPFVARDFSTVSFTGDVAAGSNTILNVSSTSGLAVGQNVTSVLGGLSAGYPVGYLTTFAKITSISGSTITLSAAGTNNGTGVQLFTGYGMTGASHAGTFRNNPSGINIFAAGTSKYVGTDPFFTDYNTPLPTAGATSPAQLFGASIGLQMGSSFTDMTNFTGSSFELTGEDHQTETIGFYVNENFRFDGHGIIDYEYGTPLVQVSQSQAGTIQFLGDVNVRETAFERSHVFNQTSMANVTAGNNQYSVGTTPAVNPRARIIGDLQQNGTYYTNYFSVQNLTNNAQHTGQILATVSVASGVDLFQIRANSNTNAGHNLLHTFLAGNNAITLASGAHYTAQTQGYIVFQVDAQGNVVSSGTVTSDNINDSGWINITGFSNGFTASSPTPAYRLINNVVYLRGSITGGTASGVAFTLPSGFRPGILTRLSTPFTYVDITSAGAVTPYASTVTSLDNVIFPIG